MDPDTGAAIEVIGQPLDANGIRYGFAAAGFSSDGTLYAVAAGPDELITVDTTTGLVTVVGDLGFNALSVGGTILDGVFYLVSGQRPNNNLLLSCLRIATTNPDPSTAAGSANSPIPRMATMDPKNFPTGVMGVMSP